MNTPGGDTICERQEGTLHAWQETVATSRGLTLIGGRVCPAVDCDMLGMMMILAPYRVHHDR